MPIERTRIGSLQEKEEEGQGKEDFIRSARWSVNNPSSIPREILDLAPETALSIIQSRIPLTQVSNADARIKLGPGVTSVPEKIDDFLSLGHRFLSPSVFNVSLPLEAFSSLSTRLKWKVFFAHKQAPSDFLERNSQYRIPKPETIAVPASTLNWVEDMLDRGRTDLVKQLRAMPDSAKNTVITLSYKSELKCLENWRNMNNVLVLQSDEKLGTTGVCVEWYNEKLDALVLNNSDFTEIINYCGKFIPVFDEIRRCKNKHPPQEVKDFILESCNIEDVKLPRFHGIPKIHKEPWALRPIVPCHSYPLANASKVLSHLLKLRVRESRWILESSQELARLLEGIRIPSGKKYWLCTGDVVAMYPNIPRTRAQQFLGEIARDACPEPKYVNLITKLA